METIDNIAAAYSETFPKSFILISKGCLGGDELYIKGYVQNKNDWQNGISHNDPLTYMATFNPITNVYKEESLYLTVRATNPYMAFGSVKLRKKTIKNATPEKLAARFEQIKTFIKSNQSDMVHDITNYI